MPVFSIAPVRLTIAVICAVLALILLLWALIRRAVKRARFGRHTSGGTSVYNAGYKGRGGWAAGRRSRSAVPRHHRPSVGRRRYGRGSQPAPTRPKRKRVSRRKYGKFEYHGHTGGGESGRARQD